MAKKRNYASKALRSGWLGRSPKQMFSTMILAAVVMVPAVAKADPKPEALDAIKWGLDYCKDGLKPEKDLGDVEGFTAKFQARLKTATTADPSIRSYSGEIRGMKVSEWIPKCEKELPARVQTMRESKAVRDAVRSAVEVCTFSKAGNAVNYMDQAIEEFSKKKAAAIAANKGPSFKEKIDGDDPPTRFAICDREMAERRTALVKRDAENKAKAESDAKKFAEQQAADRKKKEDAQKKLRASLKGDRGKIYDRYGEPTNWDGDLDKTNEWRWHLSKTHPASGVEADCLTVVKFKGNKKASETETAPCKW